MNLALESHIFETDAYPLHYYTCGDPQHECIVLLHQSFGDHACFQAQFAELARNYRVIAFDLIGHGRSQARNAQARLGDMSQRVIDVLRHEGVARAHILGVSLGSLIAQDVAVRFPETAISVTVVGGYPIFGTDKAIQRTQFLEMLKWVGMVFFSMERFYRYLMRITVITPEAQAQVYRSAQHFTLRSFQAMQGLDTLMRPQFQPHQHPLLVVTGEHDREIVHRVTKTWSQREPQGEFHLLRGAGHCANMDRPSEFNHLLQSFLARHAISQPS